MRQKIFVLNIELILVFWSFVVSCFLNKYECQTLLNWFTFFVVLNNAVPPLIHRWQQNAMNSLWITPKHFVNQVSD